MGGSIESVPAPGRSGPNLVNVVKGYAAHEKEVLTQVTEARARVGAIQATPELLNNEEAFKKFIAAQGQMTSAISRLLVVAENYPQLKADGLFRDLQAQLEGTENRITVARNRYIAAVKEYNIIVRSFPTNLTAMLFGHKTKPSFTVENEKAISEPPKLTLVRLRLNQLFHQHQHLHLVSRLNLLLLWLPANKV
jgi:LemA protein